QVEVPRGRRGHQGRAQAVRCRQPARREKERLISHPDAARGPLDPRGPFSSCHACHPTNGRIPFRGVASLPMEHLMKRLSTLLLTLAVVLAGCNIKVNVGPDAGKQNGGDGGMPGLHVNAGGDAAENAAEEAFKVNGNMVTREWNAPGKP